ncbi:MAG TPA: DNA repair protein RecN [Thermoanaerobaculia bacterium]|nr:DNA repair protein RecN [Thermoanaerobaculia bacterium]
MITYLKVRNLAIVEEFCLEPGPGLNVLTGETGAGKSLLIDSLQFLAGERGSTDVIRDGADRMTAEASFQIPTHAVARLDAMGIETGTSENGAVELIVRREINSAGRGRVFMNGSLMNLRDLTPLTENLLQIHGQNAAHDRIAGKNALELVDQFAQHESLVSAVADHHKAWRSAAEDVGRLIAVEQERTLRIDQLRYQIDEISSARLSLHEEESLRSERNLLSHSEEILAATSGAFAALDEDEVSALSQISRAAHLLQPLTSRIPEIAEAVREMEDARLRTQEVARTIASIAQETRHDPARLEEVEERLTTIERLEKKYGHTVADVLEHLQHTTREYEELSDYELSAARLRKVEETAWGIYLSAAADLAKGRRRAAAELQVAIQNELDDLAMEQTRVEIETSAPADLNPAAADRSLRAFGPAGYDRVEILIAPNRGESMKPLQRIASGGELSRIQLAVAAALFRHVRASESLTLVFDEIDAGIGGRVADIVGRKLRELSATSQVICVTHLPQIASFGSTHFLVTKEEAAGRTRATIQPLESKEERISELARMLGGEMVSETAISHARDLLERAVEVKRSPRQGRRAG